MGEQSIFWQILRSLLFVLGAGLIITLQIQPNNFGTNSLFFQHSLFVWCAAFLHRRPGSANDVSVFFVALLYAVYIEEGMALGAASLLVFLSILRYLRKYTMSMNFVFEIATASAVYFLILCTKNILLIAFLAPHYNLLQLITLSLSFIVSYPVFNLIIVAIVRSRKERGFVT